MTTDTSTQSRLYGVYNQAGRLYGTQTYAEDDPDRPLNSILIPEFLIEAISDNPMLMLDYVVESDELIRQSEFDPVTPPPPPQNRTLVRVADPETADVILDGDQLLLQKSESEAPVRVTLIKASGTPIITVDLDQPVTVQVDGRVRAVALSGDVFTFFQRLAKA